MQRGLFNRVRVGATCLLLAAALSGCESFDPASLTDWIPDSKKKLQGERKEVFPGGVPGVPQGVPPELVKGNQPPPDAAVATTDQTESPQQQEKQAEEKPKPKPKPKPKTAAAPKKPPTAVTVGPQGQQPQSAEPAQAGASPWPAAPAAQPAQSQSNWPAAPAPGSFSR